MSATDGGARLKGICFPSGRNFREIKENPKCFHRERSGPRQGNRGTVPSKVDLLNEIF